MRKLKIKLSAWWFYLSPEAKEAIEFAAGVLMCISLLGICLLFGHLMGKAGFE